MNGPNAPSSFSLLVIAGGVANASPAYSLGEVARIVGLHPERLRLYCQRGLFGADLARTETDPVFNDDQLYEVRRFEHFRRHHRLNQETLHSLCDLWREVDRLKGELRFYHGR